MLTENFKYKNPAIATPVFTVLILQRRISLETHRFMRF